MMAWFGFIVAVLVSGLVLRLAYGELRDNIVYGAKRGDWYIAASVTGLAILCAGFTIYFNPITNICGC